MNNTFVAAFCFLVVLYLINTFFALETKYKAVLGIVLLVIFLLLFFPYPHGFITRS
jgi:hypothetical protein